MRVTLADRGGAAAQVGELLAGDERRRRSGAFTPSRAGRSVARSPTLVAVPVAPEIGLERHLAEALDGVRQPALERQPAHLAVGHDLDAGLLLQRHGRVHRRILDRLELGRRHLAGLEPVPGFEQCRGPQQAADHIGVRCDHGSAV